MGTHFLDCLFSPQAIAVFGASERSDTVGGRVFDNLRKGGFSGPIYAINPKYKRLFHEPCYQSITNIGKPIDLVVIATPAPTIAEIIHACGENGVRAAIIISTGFSESDSRGSALKKAVLDYLAQDLQTYSIILYVEGVRDARSFMSGLRIAARMKPVLVIKAGRHDKFLEDLEREETIQVR